MCFPGQEDKERSELPEKSKGSKEEGARMFRGREGGTERGLGDGKWIDCRGRDSNADLKDTQIGAPYCVLRIAYYLLPLVCIFCQF